jgi:hypothetical protein
MKITINKSEYKITIDDSRTITVPREVVASLIHTSLLFREIKQLRRAQQSLQKQPTNKSLKNIAQHCEKNVDTIISRIERDSMAQDGTLNE